MKISLTLRLAVLVGVLGLLQAAAVLVFSYVTLRGELDAQQRTALRDKLEQARHFIGTVQDAEALKSNAYRLFELVEGQPNLHIGVAVSGSHEAHVAFSGEAVQSLGRLRNDVWGTDAFLEWKPEASTTTMLSLASAGRTADGQNFELVVSANRTKDERTLRKLLVTAGTGAPFALVVVTLTAVAVVALGLQPLVRLRHAVSRVRASRLDERLDPAGLPRELQELADAFNAMLERLDDSVSRLSRFSADLAHEMRTPLSTVLGRTQVILSKPRDPEELQDVLVQNVDELQRLSRLVSDMLFLAQADQADEALHLESVELGAEAARIADFLAIAAEEKAVTISVHGSACVQADRGLVQRAITNLVSNAVRHARGHSEVRVKVEADESDTCVTVENEGEAIPAEHVEHLFDRFYRVDLSRQRKDGGVGLGLSIVRAIMALHGGSSEVRSTLDGPVRFTLRFPFQPEPWRVRANTSNRTPSAC